MRKYILFSLSLLMVSPLTTMAQDDSQATASETKRAAKVVKKYPVRTVRGKVIDGRSHQPLAGVMVSVPDVEGYSSMTGDDGTYQIEVPRFANMLQLKSPEMNVTLMGLRKTEEQPTAVLYPTGFSSEYDDGVNLTSTTSAQNFKYSNDVSIESEIQKKLGAEMHTTLRNGTPGLGGIMLANGLSSLNTNAQPLVVVDGVIYDQQYGREMLHSGFHNDILSNISVTDIEKVTLLRNGTALYGSKGANGVLLIETRRNHSMATRITASLAGGVTLEPKFIDMMNASQFKSYASDLLGTTNTSITDFKFLNEDPTYYYYPQYHNNTDWKDLVYRTAFTQNYSVNVEGGDDVANYNLSLGYVNQQSTLKYNGMNRLNIRFNTDIALSTAFSLRFDASFDNQRRNLRNDGAPLNYTEGTPSSPSFLAYAKSPMLSPYAYSEGVLSHSFIDINDETYLDEALALYDKYNYKLANPVAINIYGDGNNKNHFQNSMVSLSVTPKYKFNSHLTLSEHFAYNLVNTNEKYYIPLNGVPSYYVSALGVNRENEVRSLASKQNSVFSDLRLDWANRYGAHDLQAFGGARIIWESYSLNTQLGYNTGNDKTPFISSSLQNAQAAGADESWDSWAWYAQVNYNYLQRYYAQLNLTAETSSRFGHDAADAIRAFSAPWGLFYGLQAGWLVSNEPWFTPTQWLNYLKLSAGYDVSGNDDIDPYAARSYFAGKQFLSDVSGLSFENIGNNELQWETTRRFNVGIEANFLSNRLNLRANYFNSHISNLLTYQSLGWLSGLKRNWSNGGKMKNQGFDVTLSGKAIVTKDWQWELGVSVGHYKNELTALPEGQNSIDNTVYGATIRSQIGGAANRFYGYKTEGVFATTAEAKKAGLYIVGANGIDHNYFSAGDMHFVDLNGDHQITDADRTFIGDPNPKAYGNVFTSLSYKRFRLDANFNYCLGNDVFNYQRQQLESGSRFINQTTAMLQRWQSEGDQTSMPRVSFQDPMGNSRFSDRWIEDGSYFRLKTVTLSYTLPVHTSYLQGLEFWVQANNVFTLTKYLGSDPEFAVTSSVIGQGIDAGQLPQSRSFVAGVKINL